MLSVNQDNGHLREEVVEILRPVDVAIRTAMEEAQRLGFNTIEFSYTIMNSAWLEEFVRRRRPDQTTG